MSSQLFRGIVLAGGSGTRLYPLTLATSKQLLPVYDKPMVYYPLSVLMLAGIREILIISTPQDIGGFQRLFGDGSRIGLSIEYAVQEKPAGLPQAFVIAEPFLKGANPAMVLGDNVFYGQGFISMLERASARPNGATVFACPVRDASRYGVIEVNSAGKVLSVEEKPPKPRSNLAITGLYFFDHAACEVSRRLAPSPRGELEITDVIRHYMNAGVLSVERFTRGFAWLDMGTHESLLQAANFVQTIESRQGLKIACLEEIAYRKGFIDVGQLERLGAELKNEYGRYLLDLLRDGA